MRSRAARDGFSLLELENGIDPQDFAQLYPQFGFERNKGYGSAEHLRALSVHGPCPIHRFSFSPIKELFLKTK